jgi:hypothetical protein
MSKIIIENYTFSAIPRTITFTDYQTISKKRILAIVNQSTGTILYQANNSTKSGTVATNVLTLTGTNLGTLTNSDDLSIIYDDAGYRDITNISVTMNASVNSVVANSDINVSDVSEVIAQVQGANYASGQIRFEATIDGTTYRAIPVIRVDNDTATSQNTGVNTTISSNGIYKIQGYYKRVRAAINVAGSGAGDVVISYLLKEKSIEPQEVSADIITRNAGASTTDASITTGGTAQQVVASNPQRRGFELQNTSNGDLRIRFSNGSDASANNGLRISAGGYYSTDPTYLSTARITIFGATTGQTFTFTEF